MTLTGGGRCCDPGQGRGRCYDPDQGGRCCDSDHGGGGAVTLTRGEVLDPDQG